MTATLRPHQRATWRENERLCALSRSIACKLTTSGLRESTTPEAARRVRACDARPGKLGRYKAMLATLSSLGKRSSELNNALMREKNIGLHGGCAGFVRERPSEAWLPAKLGCQRTLRERSRSAAKDDERAEASERADLVGRDVAPTPFESGSCPTPARGWASGSAGRSAGGGGIASHERVRTSTRLSCRRSSSGGACSLQAGARLGSCPGQRRTLRGQATLPRPSRR